MAIKSCRECGADVSTEAQSCPKCGAVSPTGPKMKPEEIVKGIIGLFVFCAIAYVYFSPGSDSGSATLADFSPGSDSGSATPAAGQQAQEQPSCRTDWRLCSDNAQMANENLDWLTVRADCSIAAKNVARYGEPRFPWGAFGTFLVGDDYPKTGLVTAVEPEAQFGNAYGAMVKSRVTCRYDLNARRVTDIQVVPR